MKRANTAGNTSIGEQSDTLLNDVLRDAFKLVGIELHHVLVFDVIGLVDEFPDHVIIMFVTDDAE